MNALQKLRQQVDTIRTSKNGLHIVDAWTLAERLLMRMPVNAAELDAIFKAKDADALDALVARLENPAPKPKAALPEFDEHAKSEAMRAFRKRLKLGRLAEESKLGGRYTSGGKKSAIDAIVPPTDYPPELWKALARDGKLVDTGHGMYALPKDDPSNRPPKI